MMNMSVDVVDRVFDAIRKGDNDRLLCLLKSVQEFPDLRQHIIDVC